MVILRLAEVDAEAYVASPAKATVTVYVPVVAGAVVLTKAMPRPLVTALRVAPLREKVTVFPAMGVKPPVWSHAERVIEAPGAAFVGPV